MQSTLQVIHDERWRVLSLQLQVTALNQLKNNMPNEKYPFPKVSYGLLLNTAYMMISLTITVHTMATLPL